MAQKSLSVGDATASDHQLLFNIGAGAANPGLQWNNTSGEIETTTDGVTFGGIGTGAVTFKNDSGVQIVNGDLVYVSGWSGTILQVKKALVSTTNVATLYASYIATATIANAANGVFSQVRNLSSVDTSGGTVGRPVFLNTVAGTWSVTQPAADNRVQIVGTINVVHSSTGRITVQLPGQILDWNLTDF